MDTENNFKAWTQWPPSIAFTGGQVLHDGTVIELVSRKPGTLAVLKFDGESCEIGPQMLHDGILFTPVELDRKLITAIRFPTGKLSEQPGAKLFWELQDALKKYTTLDGAACEVAAAFVMLTWIADLLAFPITLFLHAFPDLAAGAQVLLLLSALSRLPLPLAGFDAQNLGILPDSLPLTFLLLRPSVGKRSLEVLSAMGWRGFSVCRKGTIVDSRGAKAIVHDSDLGAEMSSGSNLQLEVPGASRTLPTLGPSTLAALAADFGPKLLSFRLKQCRMRTRPQSAESPTPSASGTPSPEANDSRMPANSFYSSVLQAFFEGDGTLEDIVTKFLDAASGEERDLPEPRTLLIEVLLARCHERERKQIYVAEATLDVECPVPCGRSRIEAH